MSYVQVYAEAVAFIFPSLAEGFGLPLLEAMAVGCPVIASDIPVFREIADPSVLFFDPYSVDDLVAAMRRCLENPPDAKAAAAKEHARSFSWERRLLSSLRLIVTSLGYNFSQAVSMSSSAR